MSPPRTADQLECCMLLVLKKVKTSFLYNAYLSANGRIDGYARDVTLRYTKNFYAKTSKLRVPTKPNEPQWWSDIVMGFLQRPQHLVRNFVFGCNKC